MILYRDVISGDEIVSDAYKITEIGNGVAIEVDCKMITVTGNDDFDIGANPSAEEEEDGPIPEDAQVVNNVVYSFRLQETHFDKASYKIYMKGYMKSIRKYLQENNPERVPATISFGTMIKQSKMENQMEPLHPRPMPKVP